MALKTFNNTDLFNVALATVKKVYQKFLISKCANCAENKEAFESGGNLKNVHVCVIENEITLNEFKMIIDPLEILLECARYAENLRWLIPELKKNEKP